MSEPVRVLQVLGSSAGGVARHVRQLAEALGAPPPAGPGWTVRVAGPGTLAADVVPDAPAGAGRAAAPGVGPGAPDPAPDARDLSVAGTGSRPPARVGFHAVEIADRPRPTDAGAVRRLRALAAGADVVHAHGLRAGALTVLAARALPAGERPRVVVTLHNLPVGGRAIQAVSGVLERVVARGADVVLGVSGDLVARARALGARAGERALVPAPRPATVLTGPAEVRRSVGVAEGDALVVTVARLAPQKGLDTLLDAAAALRATGRQDRIAPEVLWVVAGDGPLRGRLAHRIADERLPVRLLGRRGDAADLLAAADVVVSSAVWEGQPLAVQEALGLGAALVATDAGGTREVTGDDGAVLVPVGDADALAAAVGTLLRDPEARDALRDRARARAAALPDVAAVVDQLRRVYGR